MHRKPKVKKKTIKHVKSNKIIDIINIDVTIEYEIRECNSNSKTEITRRVVTMEPITNSTELVERVGEIEHTIEKYDM